VDNRDEPVTGHLMAESAASRLAGANDEHADHAADAALAINILALNNTVMDLTDALTKKNIRCEFVHHQLGLMPSLLRSLQVDQLERLIASMCGITQQNSAAIAASESPQTLAQQQFAYPAIPVPDRGTKRRRAIYVQGSAVSEVPAAERYSIISGMSLEKTLKCRPDLADAASFMVNIRDLSSRGVRATIKVLRTVWANRVPAINTYFTQGLFSMTKLMAAAGPAVAESGGKPKKIKTMQELWEARPDLKEASLFMANLVKENPKMTKVELNNQWEIQRGVYPETSGVHMESKSLFSHGYLSMKILKEHANRGNRKASSSSSDANATAAAAAEIHVGGGGGTFAEAGGRGGVSSGGGRAASDAANANAAAAPAAAANVLAAADAWTDTTILDAVLNRDPPFTRHDCSVEVKSVGMKSMEGTS
jgi:hypothetical protein